MPQCDVVVVALKDLSIYCRSVTATVRWGSAGIAKWTDGEEEVATIAGNVSIIAGCVFS